MINGDEMLLIYPPPPPINIYPQHEKLFRWTGFAFIDFYSIPNCCSFFSLSNRNLHKNNESSIRKLIFLHVALFSMRTHNIQAISLVFFFCFFSHENWEKMDCLTHNTENRGRDKNATSNICSWHFHHTS